MSDFDLERSIQAVVDVLGAAGVKVYLGDGQGNLLPSEARDGNFAPLLRNQRCVYIRDGNGNVGLAILEQNAGIPYREDATLANGNYLVETIRRGKTLYVTRLARESLYALGGSTPAEQQSGNGGIVVNITSTSSTPITLLTLAVPTNSLMAVTVYVIAVRTDYQQLWGSYYYVLAARGAGNITFMDATQTYQVGGASTLDVVSALTVLIFSWSGVNGETWKVRAEFDVVRL